MLPTVKPDRTKSWKKLKDHHKKMARVHMRELFEKDPERFKKFSIRFDDILFDYSKNRITEKTLQQLLLLAEECGLQQAISSMFSGQKINETEGRAVLHIALRNFSGKPISADG